MFAGGDPKMYLRPGASLELPGFSLCRGKSGRVASCAIEYSYCDMAEMSFLSIELESDRDLSFTSE